MTSARDLINQEMLDERQSDDWSDLEDKIEDVTKSLESAENTALRLGDLGVAKKFNELQKSVFRILRDDIIPKL